jgi:hypothetical protein
MVRLDRSDGLEVVNRPCVRSEIIPHILFPLSVIRFLGDDI